MATNPLRYARMFEGLEEFERTGDGAINVANSWNRLDGSAATCQRTLADPTIPNLIVFEAVDISNVVDVDYTASSGPVTWTPDAVGDMLILIGNKSGVWTPLAST